MKTGMINLFKPMFNYAFEDAPFKDFEFELKSHPDFPTLKAVSDTLEKFGIENAPVRLKPYELENLDSPYLAYAVVNGHEELTYVAPQNDKTVAVTAESKATWETSLFDFSSDFGGIAVLRDLEHAQLPKANVERRKERLLKNSVVGLSLITVFSLMAAGFWQRSAQEFSSIQSLFFLITKVIGLAVACALVLKDIGVVGNLLDKVCKVSEKANCNAVLESKFATIYGWLKWSDLGLIYFLSGLFWLAAGYQNFAAAMSFVAAPYILVSLYQQAFVLKKFCPLCLGVLTVLATELTFSITLAVNTGIGLEGLMNPLVFSLAIASAYFLFKSSTLEARTKQQTEIKYNRLKAIPEVFTEVVSRESQLVLPKVPASYLTFGEKSSDILSVHAFLSLHCGHCSELFRQFDQLMADGHKFNLDLSINFDPENQHHVALMEKVIATHEEKSPEEAWSILATWFGDLKDRPYQKQTEMPSEALKKNFFRTKHLMNANKLSALPVVFVEGFEKSKHYKLSEYIKNTGLLKHPDFQPKREIMINI